MRRWAYAIRMHDRITENDPELATVMGSPEGGGGPWWDMATGHPDHIEDIVGALEWREEVRSLNVKPKLLDCSPRSRRPTVADIDWSQYCVVRIAEYDAMKGEIELLQEAASNRVDLCTEEQHTVEMLCLHRAAMKYDPWEYVQTYGRGLRQNEETAAGNAAQQQPMCVDNPAEGTAVDDIVTRERYGDEYSDVLGVFSDAAEDRRARRLDLRANAGS
jgi:hypothetical protein